MPSRTIDIDAGQVSDPHGSNGEQFDSKGEANCARDLQVFEWGRLAPHAGRERIEPRDDFGILEHAERRTVLLGHAVTAGIEVLPVGFELLLVSFRNLTQRRAAVQVILAIGARAL